MEEKFEALRLIVKESMKNRCLKKQTNLKEKELPFLI